VTLNEFIARYQGKYNIGDTPENTGECVGLVQVWINELGQPHIWGHAKSLVANADPSAYQAIYNFPDNFPQPGDIVCWGETFGGGYGHTGVVVRADVNSMDVFQQNDPMGSTPHLKTYNYNGVQGWIRPRVLSNQGTSNVSTLDLARARVLAFAVGGRNGQDGSVNALNGECDGDLNVNHVGKDAADDIWHWYISGEGQGWIANRLPAVYQRAHDFEVQNKGQQTVINELSVELAKLKVQLQAQAQAPTTPLAPTPEPKLVEPAKDKASENPVNTANGNTTAEPVKEGVKTSTRTAILAAVSFGVSYLLENVVPGLPKNEIGTGLTLVLTFLDKYIHENQDIKANGLLPF
jgi:hypothetical protein